MVVVRFAPSPTGFLHLGSARTALFNWILARHHKGKFILRIEDTDQVRSEEKFLEEILRDLRWMGIDWDEEPVRQSRRFHIYRAEAEKLLAEGKAYKEGEAIIFKVGKGRNVEIDDLTHGKIVFNTDEIKDQVMIKSDGSPTYNFCCVVDDSAQGVTHILRGDDHISNTPKQILFYEALGKALPKFCHIPLVMGADGAKLSKRHGAVSVEEYKNEGFLPEALVNYLLLLGWSPKDGKEVLSMKEAIELFDEKDMGGVQSRFDLQKLRWLNAEHIMKISDIDIEPLLIEQFKAAGIEVNTAMLKKLVPLYKVRAKTLKEFVELTECFFKDDHAKDPEAYKKNLSTDESRTLLKEYSAVLEALPDFKAAAIEKSCQDFAAAKGVKGGKIIHPVRVAISGKTIGAGLFEMMEVMGKGTVIKRINEAAK